MVEAPAIQAVGSHSVSIVIADARLPSGGIACRQVRVLYKSDVAVKDGISDTTPPLTDDAIKTDRSIHVSRSFRSSEVTGLFIRIPYVIFRWYVMMKRLGEGKTVVDWKFGT